MLSVSIIIREVLFVQHLVYKLEARAQEGRGLTRAVYRHRSVWSSRGSMWLIGGAKGRRFASSHHVESVKRISQGSGRGGSTLRREGWYRKTDSDKYPRGA